MDSLWKSGAYNRINNGQFCDALETMRNIRTDNIGPVDIIVDVGCGSGNVTFELSKTFPDSKLFASDVDPKMVQFAKDNYGAAAIHYFVQDIGLPWEKLHPILHSLEGRVSLVWSNYVLHWVKNLEEAFRNIGRLLKPKGYCYFNIAPTPDPETCADTQEIKLELKRYFSFRTEQEELNEWKELLEKAFQKVNIHRLERHWTYETSKHMAIMLNFIKPMLFKHYNCKLPDKERKVLFAKVARLYKRKLCTPHETKIIVKLPQYPIDMYIKPLRAVCQK